VPFIGRIEQRPARSYVRKRSGEARTSVAGPRRRYDANGAGWFLRRRLKRVHEEEEEKEAGDEVRWWE